MRITKHLEDTDFNRLLHESLPTEERVQMHLHLVGCESCGSRFLAFDEEAAVVYLGQRHGLDVVRRWRKAMAEPVGLPAFAVPVELASALAAGEELEQYDPCRWPMLTGNLPKYQQPSLVLFMLESAREQWHDDPEEAELRVRAALSALNKSDSARALRAPLLAKAHSYDGNLHRIFGRHALAWRSLEQAREWVVQCESEDGIEAEIAWHEGALLRDACRYPEAIEKLEYAVGCSKLSGGEEVQDEALVTLGITYGEAGRLDDSIRSLESVLARRAKWEFRPELYLATVQSLALRYVHVGQPEKARAMLHDIRTVAEDLGQHMNLLRVTWLEAEICHEEGNRVGAATRYREVQEGFLAKGIPYDAALASLSLAELHLEHDDTVAAAELAEELIPIFQTKGIHREATAAGLILVESLRREKATVDQVRQVAETVRASRSGSAVKEG